MKYDLNKLLKRLRKKHKQRRNCSYWEPHDMANFSMNRDKDIIVGVGSFEEYVSGTILQKRFKENKETHITKTKVIATKKDWDEFLETHYPSYRRVQSKAHTGWSIDDSSDSYIDFYISGDTYTIEFVGDKSFVDSCKETVENHFQVVQSYIKWIHDTNGSYITTSLNDDMLPIESMYPFLNGESLHQYYDRYLNSTASILLLIGPPGTGKTSFLRGLLDYAKTSATVTYDPNILEKDGVFADFLEDEESTMMILEDSDAFLSARTSGNTIMHRFLNVSNGLVTVKGKKMIFSTNLPSVKDVDPALTRPGRCFDIVKFSELNHEQAKKVAKDFDITLTTDKSSYTLAEIFHEMNVRPTQKFGFNQ